MNTPKEIKNLFKHEAHPKSKQLKLHLGCGKKKFKGFVNIDYDKKLNPDIVLDFEKQDLPFKNNSVDYIYSDAVFEHLDSKTLKRLYKECFRVMKKGAIIKIGVPHFTNGDAFSSPVHISQFSIYSFKVLTQDYKYSTGFKNYYCKIFLGKRFQFWNYIIEPIINYSPKIQILYETTILRNLFPANSIIGILVK